MLYVLYTLYSRSYASLSILYLKTMTALPEGLRWKFGKGYVIHMVLKCGAVLTIFGAI